MYTPAAFAETNQERLFDFIEQHSFGALVGEVDGVPFVTHLPFLLEREAGPNGALVGHMARANPHWKHLGGRQALAIFSGPHAYISPTWYEAEHVVPTWNYIAVHATGPLELVDDGASLMRILTETVRTYEQALPTPWSFDASDPFFERLAAQVVGFRIPIARLEGKWKLNQNHPAERRQKVIRALSERQDEYSRAIATLMQSSR